LEATAALRRATTYPLAVNTALACAGDVNEALTNCTSSTGVNHLPATKRMAATAAINTSQKNNFFRRFDFLGGFDSYEVRSMRSALRSVSRVAINQVRLRRNSAFSTPRPMVFSRL
jgi:hypothetical protein